MQVLYSHLQDKEIPYTNLEKNLLTNIDEALRLYLYQIYLLCKTAEFAVEDASIRSSKFLPNEKDKQISVRIFHNQVIQRIFLDEDFKKQVHRFHFELLIDKDFIRKFFHELNSSKEYEQYVNEKNPSIRDDKKILFFLFHSILMRNELCLQHLEDNFNNWADDTVILSNQLSAFLENITKQLEKEVDEKKRIKIPNNMKEENEFASELLNKTYYNEQYLEDLIQPKLKNWDMDRVAQTDLIVIKMAIAEMLYFPSIPVKATMNEYIDIVKSYSTPKSNEFVNGIIDRILKDLQSKNLIKKEGRGLIEL
ncbi:MAG TPA: transcription antitermination factor NusB [Bacteroidetes bacterium]|nr:transcription antitermination factor NusB [Bacteroidota bacterium]